MFKGIEIITERKWRIIQADSRHVFYEKIAKYEELNYELLPDSFNVATRGTVYRYFALMRKA